MTLALFAACTIAAPAASEKIDPAAGAGALPGLQARVDALYRSEKRQPTFPPSSDAVKPDLFGTVALPVRNTRMDNRWRRVSAPIEPHWLVQLIAPVRHHDKHQQLRYVQQSVNRLIRFRLDDENWDEGDRWATVAETMRRGAGDCEDIAIIKLHALRQLGFGARDLYLTIGKFNRAPVHAMLVARVDWRFWVLDIRVDSLGDAATLKDFKRLMTLGADNSWLHGRPIHSVFRMRDYTTRPTFIPASAASASRD